MRVVSWNMAYWKPAVFRTIENRRRQWAYLVSLAPDIALLQECRADDLYQHAPGWAAKEYEIIGHLPDGWSACSAILARRELRAQEISPGSETREEEWLEYLNPRVRRALVDDPTFGQIRVASVHPHAGEVKGSVLTDEDHQLVKRSDCRLAWHNDLAAFALRPWVGESFIVSGDWNTARLFDENYNDWGNAGSEFFEVLDGWGWSESLRKYHAEEVRTYLDPDSAPYELDHLFTDRSLHDCLVMCEVIDDFNIRQLSDHAPIVADFERVAAPSGGARLALPFNRKERFFTGTVLPMLFASPDPTGLSTLFGVCGMGNVHVSASSKLENLQFFTEYGFGESLVGKAKTDFADAPGLLDTPDVVIHVAGGEPALLAIEAKVYDKPSEAALAKQMEAQAVIVSYLVEKLEIPSDRWAHVALLPEQLAAGLSDEFGWRVVTWQQVLESCRTIAPPYWMEVLEYAMDNYDTLKTQSTSGANAERKIPGSQIIAEYTTGDLDGWWMGRQGGSGGSALTADVETGGWQAFSYECSSKPVENANWFPVADFVQLVSR